MHIKRLDENLSESAFAGTKSKPVGFRPSREINSYEQEKAYKEFDRILGEKYKRLYQNVKSRLGLNPFTESGENKNVDLYMYMRDVYMRYMSDTMVKCTPERAFARMEKQMEAEAADRKRYWDNNVDYDLFLKYKNKTRPLTEMASTTVKVTGSTATADIDCFAHIIYGEDYWDMEAEHDPAEFKSETRYIKDQMAKFANKLIPAADKINVTVNYNAAMPAIRISGINYMNFFSWLDVLSKMNWPGTLYWEDLQYFLPEYEADEDLIFDYVEYWCCV